MIFHQQGTRGRLAFSNISDQVFVAKFDTKTMDDLVVLRNLIRSNSVRGPFSNPDDLFRRVAFGS